MQYVASARFACGTFAANNFANDKVSLPTLLEGRNREHTD